MSDQNAYTILHGVRSGLLWKMEHIKSPGEMDFSTTDSVSVQKNGGRGNKPWSYI